MGCAMKSKNILMGMSAFALSVTPLLADAQTADSSEIKLEEIIVTAERRTVDLQKTAVSIVAIDGATLESRGDSSVAQVLRTVPGITIEAGSTAPGAAGTPGPPRVSIRGIGTDGPNKSSATAFYEDGVFLTGGGAYFHDIERVEVLRGPQGTLYGRAATAGAVNLITNKPSQKQEATAALEFGSFNLQHISAMANQPLSDSLAVRISFNSNKRDPIYNNGYGEVDETNTRIKLLYKPSDDFSLLLSGVYYKSAGSGGASVPLPTQASKPTDWITTSLPTPSNRTDYRRVNAELNWNVGIGTLTYIPAYTTDENHNVVFNPGMATGSVTRVSSNLPHDRTQSHELRLASNSDSALSWIGGAYYYRNKYDQDMLNETYTGSPGAPVLAVVSPSLPTGGYVFSGATRKQFFVLTSKAVFGEVTFAATDSLRFLGGVRQSYDDVQNLDHTDNRVVLNQTTGAPGVLRELTVTKDYSRLDWRVRAEKDLSDNNLLYASVSTGYRPGGAFNGTTYKQETVTAFELGSKNRIGDRVTANVSGFYYKYDGFQAPANYCFPTSLGPTGPVCASQTPFLSDVMSADATFYGVEAELTAQLTNNDKLTLAPSYIRSEFKEDLVSTSPHTDAQYLPFYIGGVVPKYYIYTNGKVVPHSPKFSATADYQHQFNLANGAAITAQADARYSSKYIVGFDAAAYGGSNLSTTPATPVLVDPRLTQEAYVLSNASLMFTSANQRYNLTAYGKNLANKIIKIGLGGPLNTASVNDPRTYGLLFSAHFE